MKILVVDNFDSFTYNLVHYLEALGSEVTVIRNTEADIDHLNSFDKIVLSPGPGLPREAGSLLQLIAQNYKRIPILGVCLGMQALGDFFGEKLYNLDEVKHGVSEKIRLITPGKLFKNLPVEFEVGLYHSWAVELKDNSIFFPTAVSNNGVMMAFEHKHLPLYGVQFHPESVMTDVGKQLLINFLN